MAINHIYQDLLPAVTSYGCGSAVDWQQVFSVIRSCTQSSVGEGVVGGLASGAVLIYRESVRAMCTADRVAAGVDPEINEDLRGRTCTP
jgi:hypothetical protein